MCRESWWLGNAMDDTEGLYGPTKTGVTALSVVGPVMWHCLPDHIRIADSATSTSNFLI